MREIPLDQAPSEIATAARAAARGQIVYLTEHGERLAAIVPPEFAAEMEDLSATKSSNCWTTSAASRPSASRTIPTPTRNPMTDS